MKDYRVKETISKNGSKFQIQVYSFPFGWRNAGHRMEEHEFIHDTLDGANRHIQEIRNRIITETKYHY